MRKLAEHVWVLHLMTIATCAFFAARATSRLISSKLVTPVEAPRSMRHASGLVASDPMPPARAVGPIVSRNIFCSSCEPSAAAEAPASAGSDPATSSGPTRTSLKLILLATLVADDPSASFACILDSTTNRTGIFGIGAKLPGEASLIEVAARQVLLLNGTRQELLTLGEGVPAEGERHAASPPALIQGEFRVPDPMEGLESLAGSIKRVAGTKYSISRDLISRISSDPTLLSRSARLIPSSHEGKPNGFAVYAKPGSLPSMLGLFNGDVLQSVNGRSISAPEQALEALKALRNASHLSLTFSRKGVPLTHDYDIR